MNWLIIDNYMKLLERRLRKGKITKKQFKKYCTTLYFWGLNSEQNKYYIAVKYLTKNLAEDDEEGF